MTPLQLLLAQLVRDGTLAIEEAEALLSLVDVAYDGCPEHIAQAVARLMTPVGQPEASERTIQ